MAFTRFGSEIDILCMDEKGWCIVRRKCEDECHEWHISEFKFDKDEKFPDPVSDEEYVKIKREHI